MAKTEREVLLLCRLILVEIILLVYTSIVNAGPVPMPLEVQLDMAKSIFSGQIIQIEKNESQKTQIQWGRARVEVKETFKGEISDYAEFNVATGFNDPCYARNAASPPKIYGTGRSGIWLVDASNTVSHAYGLLSEDRKTDVQRILKDLSERNWSKPVNGLRAWASVVQYESYKNPVIIFAVQNVSDSNIYIPKESQSVFINAIPINGQGEKYSYNWGTNRKDIEKVSCRSLPAGQIVYLHPQYSYIDLAKHHNLLSGKYTVTIGCSNTREGVIKRTTPAPGLEIQIQAWKGQLQAEPVELVIKAN